MIIVYHNNKHVLRVTSKENEALTHNSNAQIATVITELALQYPESKIVWCNENYQNYLNLNSVKESFHHDKMMLSYNPNNNDFLGSRIGYIDQSPFIKINKEVTYPTWQMSSLVGVIHAKVLIQINEKIRTDSNFDYYLNSVAKICMPLGLLCYSEKKLFTENIKSTVTPKISNFNLFRFVKQHYRTRWTFLLFFNLMIYQFKFPFLALMYSCFFRNRTKKNICLDKINATSVLKIVDPGTIDVIIPTIGRKKYLYNFLKDLSQQTYLPNNVIIVEQNTLPQSVSELDYLNTEVWPFKIKHTFTNQAGACNARNIALNNVESEWLFFADDDIRISESFIESAFNLIGKYRNRVFTFNCLQENQKIVNKKIFQWIAFGSGCSIVKKEVIKDISFNLQYEFGFGEDTDFGMQIRNQGYDILHFPDPQILHLKAPVGGFRTKPDLAWNKDKIRPKPSPTILLYKMLHETKEQINGYQAILFFKYYSRQSIKNPLKYFFKFRKEWRQSLYWANKLINKT